MVEVMGPEWAVEVPSEGSTTVSRRSSFSGDSVLLSWLSFTSTNLKPDVVFQGADL